MKMNKKLVVPFLASVIGLSIAGGLGGAFAWYQFNSQVRTGFIGTSVADTGLLQIGYDNGTKIVWGRDYSINNAKLVPVTFGGLNADNSFKRGAYGYPEAGKQTYNDYTTGWKAMTNKDGYYQYDIYLRALKADYQAPGDPAQDINPGYKLVAKDVFLNQLVIEDAIDDNADNILTDAIRVHIESGSYKKIISKTAITTPLALSGNLDLDGDGKEDTNDVWNWETGHGDKVTYGVLNETQTTVGISDVTQARNSDGTYPTTSPENAKKVCTTATGATMTKVTITIWLEGWALLKNTSTGSTTSNIWNPTISSNIDVHVGMVFDVGENILG